MTDKHCSAARFYDPGDYIGRHRLSNKWSLRQIPGYPAFKLNLHGGVFR